MDLTSGSSFSSRPIFSSRSVLVFVLTVDNDVEGKPAGEV